MTPERFEREDRIAEALRDGGVAVFPTDTAYGLGGRIDRPRAVRRVFEIKRRSTDRTVPVLVLPDQARRLAVFSPVERAAADRFWPGGLTLVLAARNPDGLADGLERDGTVALRVPDYPALHRVLERTGPLVGTSANLSGASTPRRRSDLSGELLERVDVVLRGPVPGEDSSTVARWSPEDGDWTVHRTGAVTPDQLPRPDTVESAGTEEEPG